MWKEDEELVWENGACFKEDQNFEQKPVERSKRTLFELSGAGRVVLRSNVSELQEDSAIVQNRNCDAIRERTTRQTN